MLSTYIRSVNLTVISRIEKDLKPQDLISLIFLLYDVPEDAYNNILLVEQGEAANGVLLNWAQDALEKSTWKEEFIEALCICQLHNVIAKLGLNLSHVRRCFTNTSYVDPMKKALYKLCEHMTEDNFKTLQKALSTFNVHVTEYKSCELIILKLMCDSFITVNHATGERQCRYTIEMLAKIVDHIPGLRPIVEELRDVKRTYCSTIVDNSVAIMHDINVPVIYTAHDFNNEFNMIETMDIDLSSDSNHLRDDMYPIKNPDRVGTCYIINEEFFFPSKNSLDNSSTSEPLEDRHGSTKDRELLQTTMLSLNFKVCYNNDLDHEKIYSHIIHILRNEVKQDDSVFILCILSHGVKGCIVAVDYVKVEIEKIQNLIGEELYKRSIDIPKVMIIQACQIEDNASPVLERSPRLIRDGAKVVELCKDTVTSLIPDGPLAKAKKANFLICKATSPDLNAYRSVSCTGGKSEYDGSIFIKKLCTNIQKYSKAKHLCDILVKVNCEIADYFKNDNEHDQYSVSENSLTKDLYLQMPA